MIRFTTRLSRCLKYQRRMFCKTNMNDDRERKYKMPEKEETHRQKLEKEFPEFYDQNSFIDENQTGIYVGIVALSLIGIGYYARYINTQYKDELDKMKGKSQVKRNKPSIQLGGYWELTDVNNKSLSSDDLFGKYHILYFGFCNCPDVCPNALKKLQKVTENIRQSPEG